MTHKAAQGLVKMPFTRYNAIGKRTEWYGGADYAEKKN